MNQLTSWILALILGASAALHGGDKLSDAAAKGDLQSMKLLITTGESVNEIDSWGWSALMWATYNGSVPSVKWLLENGADPNLKSTTKKRFYPTGTTALGISIRFPWNAIISLLMTAKADPELLDSMGKSPMARAKDSECEACVCLMQGKPIPPSLLNSSANRVFEEKVDDLFILIDSGIIKSYDFLNTLKNEMEIELGSRHVRHLIHVVDRLNLDEEKEITTTRGVFKPKYILQITETYADVKTEQPGMPRSRSDFRFELWSNGGSDPIWVLEGSEVESRRFHAGHGIIHKRVVAFLLNCLEHDLFLQP